MTPEGWLSGGLLSKDHSPTRQSPGPQDCNRTPMRKREPFQKTETIPGCHGPMSPQSSDKREVEETKLGG